MPIRPARPDEAALLTALARRSKAHWGYDAAFLAACADELSVAPDDRAFVLEHDGVVLGFHALAPLEDDRVELTMMFVEPVAIGAGHGRALLEDAKTRARAAGARVLVVQADPHAERFYRAGGGVVVGRRPSASIPGRELPVLEIEL